MKVFGIQFSDLSASKLADLIVKDAVPAGSGPRIVVTANLDHVVQLRNNADFQLAYDRSWAATADGTPIYLYAKIRGAKVPHRVTGSDLFAAIMPELNPAEHRCYFVASTQTTADKVANYLYRRGFARSSVRTFVPPFGFERDEAVSKWLARDISDHRSTHLFFGVGAPKSEIWTDRNRFEIGDCYVLNIGAGLDFFVGEKKRAPIFFQRAGLEWLWRFAEEPRRLFPRYFINSWLLLDAIRVDLKRK
jgi:N-acetylglucosaminyldiphosphoundecaprenol N-acetyl-beta-D-mannosaminyltransferase